MDITYKTRNLKKICNDAKAAEKAHGREMAKVIHQRIDQITAADNVEMLVCSHIGRCHLLKNNRKGQYAVDLVHPYRLVFEKRDDGMIQIAHILEIVDYH